MRTLSAGRVVWWESPGEIELTPEQVALMPGLPELSLKSSVAKAVTAFARKNIVSNSNIPAHMRKAKAFKFIENHNEIRYAMVYPIVKDEQLELPVIFDVIYSKVDKMMNIVGTGALPQEELTPIIQEFRGMVDVYMRRYSSTEMALGLRSVLDKLSAVSVRPSGSVYFITENKVPELEAVQVQLVGTGAAFVTVAIESGSDNFSAIATKVTATLQQELEELTKTVADAAANPAGMGHKAYASNLARIKELHTRMKEFSHVNDKTAQVLGDLDTLYAATSKVLDRYKPVDLDAMIRGMQPVDIVSLDNVVPPTLAETKEIRRAARMLTSAPQQEPVQEVTPEPEESQVQPEPVVPTPDPDAIAAKRRQLDMFDTQPEPDFSWALT